MEPWPVSIEYQHTGLSQRLSLHSLERLNLVVTPAAFRSIGDARLFYSMMMSLSAPAPAGMAPKALDATNEAPAPAKNMLSTMYRQDPQSQHVLMDVTVDFGSSTCSPGMVSHANEHVPSCRASSKTVIHSDQRVIYIQCSSQAVLHRDLTASKMVALCRLVNRSGLRLSYWADSDEGAEPAEAGSSYTLNAWEESPLMVEPLEKTVILPDAQQQVGHNATGRGPIIAVWLLVEAVFHIGHVLISRRDNGRPIGSNAVCRRHMLCWLRSPCYLLEPFTQTGIPFVAML